MKKILSILLLICLSFQYFVQTGFIGWFGMNREEITNLFCINKEKPALHCDGKCFLKKELKVLEHDNQSQGTQQQSSEQHLFLQPNAISQIVPFPILIAERVSIWNVFYMFSPHFQLLRPPQL